ncbi:MAG: GWxTD domain-containing protein [candidate division KSB1 bacterium]|nr:GWxTD domain-containing protein [candidate division KSB1 bacterium]
MIQQKIWVGLMIFLIAVNVGSQDVFKNETQRHAVFRLILSDELVTSFDQILDPSLKTQWADKYWRMVDPTPTTEANEIYDQYLQRVQVAQRHYSNIVPPLFLDDRGKYYLKYGEPDDRVISPGLGKPYQDNETWAYYRYNLFLDFVDQPGFGYREVTNLLEAVSRGPANRKLIVAAELYAERERLHQKYLGFQDIVSGAASLSASSRFYQLTNDLTNEKKLALEAIPPAWFDFDFQQERLDAQMSSAIFRGENQLSRVELYYSIPMNQLKFQPGTQSPLESVIDLQMSIFNQDFDRVLQRNERLLILARNQDEVQQRIYINQQTEQLPPGLYHLVLQLENRDNQRLAILRGNLKVKDFSADSLSLSDIQLSSQIREDVQHQRHLKENGILVVPYVGNAIRRLHPIYIYFEIYNLRLNAENRSRFRIEYEVTAIAANQATSLSSVTQFISHLIGKKKEQKIGSYFETTGEASFQQIYLQIDFSKFSGGSCLLTISVTDLESGASSREVKRLVLK